MFVAGHYLDRTTQEWASEYVCLLRLVTITSDQHVRWTIR